MYVFYVRDTKRDGRSKSVGVWRSRVPTLHSITAPFLSQIVAAVSADTADVDVVVVVSAIHDRGRMVAVVVKQVSASMVGANSCVTYVKDGFRREGRPFRRYRKNTLRYIYDSRCIYLFCNTILYICRITYYTYRI